MSYDLFPAVDADFNFPEEVRIQLAKSEQLRNLVIPMTEETRDALTEDEKWVGRTIFNTTTQKLESLKDTGAWVSYLDETYSFPEPPPFWDENFDVPDEVRAQLAISPELRNMIVPMAESVRDSLSENEIWNGRTIYNTSSYKLEVWIEVLNRWVYLLDDTYVPSQPAWGNWEPVIAHSNNNPYFASFIKNYTSSGRYIRLDSNTHCAFNVSFTDDCVDDTGIPRDFLLGVPPASRFGYYGGKYALGNIILDQTAVGGSKRLGVLKPNDYNIDLLDPSLYRFPLGYFELYYYNSDSSLVRVTSLTPQLWTGGCKIYGSIQYHSA